MLFSDNSFNNSLDIEIQFSQNPRETLHPMWETDQHHHSKTPSTVVLLALHSSLHHNLRKLDAK